MSNATNIQIMAMFDNGGISINTTSPYQRQSIWFHKNGISTIDALVKLEQYIRNVDKDPRLLMLDLSKALGSVNRTQLWTTLYRKVCQYQR